MMTTIKNGNKEGIISTCRNTKEIILDNDDCRSSSSSSVLLQFRLPTKIRKKIILGRQQHINHNHHHHNQQQRPKTNYNNNHTDGANTTMNFFDVPFVLVRYVMMQPIAIITFLLLLLSLSSSTTTCQAFHVPPTSSSLWLSTSLGRSVRDNNIYNNRLSLSSSSTTTTKTTMFPNCSPYKPSLLLLFQSSRSTVVTTATSSKVNRESSIWDLSSLVSSSSSPTTTSTASTKTSPTFIADQGNQQQSTTTTTQATTTSPSSSSSSSIPNLTISLVKQVVGGSVLALPAGVAALESATASSGADSCNPMIIPIACCIIAVIGAMNAYFFSLCGRVCSWTGATTFKQAWEQTVGTNSSQLVSIIIAMKTALSCLALAVILGDSFANIINTTGILNHNHYLFLDDYYYGHHIVTRSESLQVLGVTVLLPLCLKKDLSSLAPFSFAGLIMILFTAGTIVYRSLDGSYDVTSNGQYAAMILQDLVEKTATATTTTLPSSSSSFDAVAAFIPPPPFVEAAVASDIITSATTTTVTTTAPTITTSIFPFEIQGMTVLACLLLNEFIAHYNAPRFYNELQNNTIERFNIVTCISYSIATILFIIIAVAGYTTFGTTSLPFVLNNYHPNDTLIALGNAAIAISIGLTFPLPFVGLRDGYMDAFVTPSSPKQPPKSQSALTTITTKTTKGERTEVITNQQSGNNNDNNAVASSSLTTIVTVGLLGMVLLLASNVSDLGAVLSIGGGTFSTIVAAVFPTLMFRAAVQKNNNNNNTNCSNSSKVVTENNCNETTTTTSTVVDHGNAKQNQIESIFALGLMSICVAVGGAGVVTALNNAL